MATSVRTSARNGGVGTAGRAVVVYRQRGASRSSGVDKVSVTVCARRHARPIFSEPVGQVCTKGAGLTHEPVVKADRAGIRVVLVQSVGDVLLVREVLDPGAGVETLLG